MTKNLKIKKSNKKTSSSKKPFKVKLVYSGAPDAEERLTRAMKMILDFDK
jgi:hypothetical protein